MHPAFPTLLGLAASACAGQTASLGLDAVPPGIERVDVKVGSDPVPREPRVVYKAQTAIGGAEVNTTFAEARALQANGASIFADLTRRVWDPAKRKYRDAGVATFPQVARWANANGVVISDTCTQPLPQVHHLHCSSHLFRGEYVRRLRSLRTLSAELNQLKQGDVAWLAQLRRLESLSVGLNRLRDVAPLAQLERLHTLELGANPVDGESLRTVLRTLALTRLGLSEIRLPKALWSQARLKELESLSVGRTNISDADLLVLAKRAHRLQSLNLRYAKQITDAGIAAAVPFLRSLRSLSLEGVALGDAGIEALAGLKTLEKLDLRFVAVTDRGLRALARLTGLKRLWLRSTDITCRGVAEALTTLTGLEDLALMSINLQCDTNIGALLRLRRLTLDHCGLGPRFMRDLGRSESLRRLSLTTTYLRDEELVLLAAVNTLRWLGLHETMVSQHGCDTLNKALGRDVCVPPRR